MDRYQRVEKPRAESPIDVNEIRITSQGRMRNYITYAMTLLQEKGSDEIVFKAMGRAINKTVTIVELIKRRIVGLHQITSIGSTDITDIWEPLEEGLLPLETTRHVSTITITLSKKELDTSVVGYQTPLPEDQVKPSVEMEYEGEGWGVMAEEEVEGELEGTVTLLPRMMTVAGSSRVVTQEGEAEAAISVAAGEGDTMDPGWIKMIFGATMRYLVTSEVAEGGEDIMDRDQTPMVIIPTIIRKHLVVVVAVEENLVAGAVEAQDPMDQATHQQKMLKHPIQKHQRFRF